MKTTILYVCFLIAIVAAEVEEENGVLVLTDQNFDETLKSKKVLLVEFYAPWCGHCKALAPEYEKAAQILAARDPPLKGVLAKVDATKETTVASKFKIEGYPTLTLFRDGEDAGGYDGARTGADIADFMAQRSDPNYKPPPSAVVTLSGENFTSFVAANDYFLLEFYAPWCGHCKSLAPLYERAAKRLKEEDPPIPLAKVDATVDKDLAKEHGVEGYPTIKLMRKGKGSEYKGSRTEEGIIEYMIKNRRDAFTAVETIKELRNLIPESRPLIVGYFPESSQQSLRATMVEATNEVREDYVSAITQSAAVANALGLTDPGIAMIQPERFQSKHEPKLVKFDSSEASVDSLKKFIDNNQFPLVGHLNWETQKFYDTVKEQIFCTVFFTVDFSFDHRKATQLWRLKLVEIAKDFKGSVVFAIANEENYEDRMHAFNLVETGVDMNIGCLKRGVRFVMPEMEEYDKDHIVSFINDVQADKAKPYLKSQPIPKKQTEPVATVVADNYDKMVFDLSKDVLVEFYSTTCGHCMAFAPTYDKLASRLKHIKTLSVMKMNAKENDVPPPMQIEYFPTLQFRASGSKEMVKYEGDRSIESLIEFMAKHAVSSKAELEKEVSSDKAKTASEEGKKEKKDEL